MSDAPQETQDPQLKQLAQQISGLTPKQRDALVQLAPDLVVADTGVREAVAQLRKTLAELRLTVKYTIFDLEATRRENVLLKKKLAGYER